MERHLNTDLFLCPKDSQSLKVAGDEHDLTHSQVHINVELVCELEGFDCAPEDAFIKDREIAVIMNTFHLEWSDVSNDFTVMPHTDIGWFSLGTTSLPFMNKVQIKRHVHVSPINEFMYYFGFNPEETPYVSTNIDTAGSSF
jgi:hypothetical protein